MIACPACAHENIPGSDQCDSCGDSLTAVTKPDKGIEARLRDTKISELETFEPVIAAKGSAIDAAVKAMQEAGRGHVFVMDGDKVIGIVTERDLLYKVKPLAMDESTTGDETIESVMTPDPLILRGEQSVSFLLNTMAVKGYRRVPVVIDGKLRIITVRLLFDHLLKLSKEAA